MWRVLDERRCRIRGFSRVDFVADGIGPFTFGFRPTLIRLAFHLIRSRLGQSECLLLQSLLLLLCLLCLLCFRLFACFPRVIGFIFRWQTGGTSQTGRYLVFVGQVLQINRHLNQGNGHLRIAACLHDATAYLQHLLRQCLPHGLPVVTLRNNEIRLTGGNVCCRIAGIHRGKLRLIQ